MIDDQERNLSSAAKSGPLVASRVIYRIGLTVKLAILFCAVRNYTGVFSIHRDDIKPVATRQ